MGRYLPHQPDMGIESIHIKSAGKVEDTPSMSAVITTKSLLLSDTAGLPGPGWQLRHGPCLHRAASLKEGNGSETHYQKATW